MARYPAGSRAGRRARNRMYTILVVIIIGIVFAYFYYPFGKDEAETGDGGLPLNANTDSNVPVISNTNVNEPPVARIEPRQILQREPNLTQIPPGPDVEPNPEAAKLIKEAETLLSTTPAKIIEARDKLNIALRMPMSFEQRKFVKSKLSQLSEQWLFGRTVFPDDTLCETYRVKPLEMLSIIGERYNVPYEALMMVNRIKDPRSLQAGQNIKVINGPFHAKVYRSTFTMDIYLQNTFVRSFVVGLGLPGQETPTGVWRVAADGKLEQPPWYDEVNNRTYFPEDPDYPLGSRWIGLEGMDGDAKGREGFAIHGTKEPNQLGTQGSRGCIRLENGDAILVYNLLFPVKSLVYVTD
ncbi:MAG: L,D-transpeptidase family protein [Sedimentisphaerales bacterium]|nr:L,D-transpeptidase family protein [Sedimentisphaerales bacterium]